MHPSVLGTWVSITLAGLARAHIAAWDPSMYCFNGNESGVVDWNTNAAVKPLYQLPYEEYWMHHVNLCDEFPPAPDEFLEFPSGGSVTLELAGNRGHTKYNIHGKAPSDWADGQQHTFSNPHTDCVIYPNLHTQNKSMAAGTAFGIAYKSTLSDVKLEDITIFTTACNTPWTLEATYKVPPSMPLCPDDGCTCVWTWIPRGCGQPNMYMLPYRCKIIPDGTTPKKIGTPKAPVWCEDDQSKCTKGAKQMLVWNQQDGNNIEVEGYDLEGQHKSPAYNFRCGFGCGAQLDIFEDGEDTLAVNSTTGSGTLPAASASPSAVSGTPTSLASAPASETPATGPGTSGVPSSVPTSTPSTGPDTSYAPSDAPSSVPTPSPLVTHAARSCDSQPETTGTPSKRMKMHRVRDNVF